MAIFENQINALAEQVDALRAELAEIAGAEEPTEEQIVRSDAALADHDAAQEKLTALRAKSEKIERAMATPSLRSSGFNAGPTPVIRKDPFEGLARMNQWDEDEVQDRAARAIEEIKYRGMPVSDEARAAALRTIEMVPGAAAHALAHGSAEYMSAFRSWLVSGGQPVYTAEEAAAVRTAMSLTSANGGYALPTLLDPTLIKTGTIGKNPIRGISRVVSGTQKVWNGVTAGNVTTAWKSEGAAFTEGSPTLGATSVTAHALTAYLAASYEIFQDSNLQAQLPGLIGEAIDQAESAAFVVGSGSGAPTGVITAVSGTAGSLVTVTTRGAFTSASTADTRALAAALPSRYEDSATWVANKATFNTIEAQAIGTAGTMLFDLSSKNVLLGAPVVRASSVTATTTSGNILAVLGDFSQFVVYDRIGVNLEYIQNVVDGDGIPTGQRGLVAFKRVGSNVTDVNAFRLLKA